MNWEIAGYIIGGIFGIFGICFFIALAEEEWKSRRREKRERKYWDERIRSLTKHC